MRKTLLFSLLALLTALLAAGVGAQSGRRGLTPPAPPPEQLGEPSSPTPVARQPLAPANLTVLPERLLRRKIQALDNGSFSLSDFEGKVIVINIWASWCGPCRREAPEYEKVRREFATREVEFIGLTTEDPRTSSERVKQFVRDFKFNFRHGWADRDTAITLMNGRSAIPQTMVIAADGHIVSHWHGYSIGLGGSHLREILQHAFSEASTPAPKIAIKPGLLKDTATVGRAG